MLARREHSRKELKYKLCRASDDEQLIEELLDRPAVEGLQSDARFAESFVHHRVNKGQGPIKIEQELKQRGIDSELIADCLYSKQFDWSGMAAEIRIKKFGAAIPGDYQKKAKQSRFLYSRGFSSEVIGQILKQ